MSKLLIPVDGSDHSLKALEAVLKRRSCGDSSEIHLLNVQLPIDSGHARMFVSDAELNAYHQAEGSEALASATKLLDASSTPYTCHIVVGHVAETIVRFAREHAFDEIIMGTHGRSALTHLLLGSIAFDVLRTTELPVTLVKSPVATP